MAMDTDAARFVPRRDWIHSGHHKRFRECHWPALTRAKKRPWQRVTVCGSARARKLSRMIDKTSKVAEARGWLPFVSLMDRHYMHVCDTLARRLRYGERRA
jgi:hypothetical protein